MTWPAAGADSATNLPDYGPTTQSAQSETRACDLARRHGLALPVIATAQLLVGLDATNVNVARPHIHRALGFSGRGLRRDAAPGSGSIQPAARCDLVTGVQR